MSDYASLRRSLARAEADPVDAAIHITIARDALTRMRDTAARAEALLAAATLPRPRASDAPTPQPGARRGSEAP